MQMDFNIWDIMLWLVTTPFAGPAARYLVGGSFNADAPKPLVWGAMLVAPFIVGLAIVKWILVRIQLSRD